MIKYYVIKYKKELLACQDKVTLKALPGKKSWHGDARVIGRGLVQCMCNRYLLGNTDNPVIKFLVPIQDEYIDNPRNINLKKLKRRAHA